MTNTLKTRVARLGLSQRAFARVIAALSGRPVQYRTIERWSMDRDAPDAAHALLTLMERVPPETWSQVPE